MKHLAFLVAMAASLIAGASLAAAPPYRPPHLADGAPDLQGLWTNQSGTPLERDAKFGDRLVMTPAEEATQNDENNFGDRFTGVDLIDPVRPYRDFLASVMRVDGQPRTSLITSPPDGRIPYLNRPPVVPPVPTDPVALHALVLSHQQNPEQGSTTDRCIGAYSLQAAPVMQSGLRINNYQIVQSKGSVAIMIEMLHDVRIVRLNQSHRTDGVRAWMGDSIGHYDGDTLVVETTNFPQANALRGAWEKLKVTERFTRVGPDRILYRFTVEDPTVFKQAWGGEYEFHSTRSPIYESDCHEGDRTLEGVLGAARYQEIQADKTQAR